MASNQQAQGIAQVSQTIAEMEKMTPSTAATAEESAAVSEELSAQAGQTMSVVRELERLVGGRAGAASTSTPSLERASPTHPLTVAA